MQAMSIPAHCYLGSISVSVDEALVINKINPVVKQPAVWATRFGQPAVSRVAI